jgi:alkylhydroperoxidase family enzyme
MSRIAPLQPPYAPEIQGQFDRIMRGAPPLVLFRVVAGNARAWEKFRAGSLLDRGPLSLREREIVIDRTCALTGCEYEWGVHVATFAQATYLTDEQVGATVLGGADAPCWSPAEQALIAAVDALHASATLDEAEFKALSAHYDDGKILRSSCAAASIGPCRILRTGWPCRWSRMRRGFRISRHCEERSDEAIHSFARCDGLPRFARNDGE